MVLLTNLITVAVTALVAITGTDARFRLKRDDQRTVETRSCGTNAECLQRGLPIHPPVLRRGLRGRQATPVTPFMNSTCGGVRTVTIAAGTYDFELHGAQGGAGTGTTGGLGGVITGTFATTTMIELNYFIGCQGQRDPGNGGGGGGGTFLFPEGTPQPAIVVAGGGGGGGYGSGNQVSGNGQRASSTNGVATAADGTTGAQNGSGGVVGSDDRSGGGGGGFKTPGGPASATAFQGSGGSQSTAQGGSFASGSACSSGCSGSGGQGGGAGGGSYGGGGGGGYSGGAGGSRFSYRGGGGGASYAPASGSTVGGVFFVTNPLITATNSGDGSITIKPALG